MSFTLTIHLSRSVRMASMAAGISSHLRVQASLTLSAPALISRYIRFISPGSLPYWYSSILCTPTRCHFRSLALSMVMGSIILAAHRITSLVVGNTIPLVAVIPRRLLRLPFLLYVMHWSRTCVGTFLMLRAVLTTSSRLPASAPAFGGRRIVLSVSIGAFTGLGNSSAALLPYVVLHSTLIAHIFQLPICHCCTGSGLAQDAATVIILGSGRGYEYVEVGLSAGAGRGVRVLHSGCSVGLSAVCCLRVFLSTAGAATSASEIIGRGVAVAGEDHVDVALAATVLCASLVSSAT